MSAWSSVLMLKTTMVDVLLKRLKNFETVNGRTDGMSLITRSSDVFVSTPSKCGTTLLQHMCHQLRSNGDEDFPEISDVVPCIEMSPDQGVDVHGAQPFEPPRLFKTHLAAQQTPGLMRRYRGEFSLPIDSKAVAESTEAFYIHCVRDPHDVHLSFYNFFCHWFFEPEELSVSQFVGDFLLNRGPVTDFLGNLGYFHHFLEHWRRRSEERVLFLCYERMVSDLPGTVLRVANFLRRALQSSPEDWQRAKDAGSPLAVDDDNWPNQSLLDLVVSRCSIDFMKQHNDKFNEGRAKRTRNELCGLAADAGAKSSKVMHGGAGRGRAQLSEALRERISALWSEIVEPETGFKNYEEFLKTMK